MVQTVAMVTTQAQGKLATIHHRMPLLLDADETEEWLDLDAGLPAWVTSTRREPEVEAVPDGIGVDGRESPPRKQQPQLVPREVVEVDGGLFHGAGLRTSR